MSCPYCQFKDEMQGGKNMIDLRLNPDDYIIQILEGRIYTEMPADDLSPANCSQSIPIKYCPMCGRKL